MKKIAVLIENFFDEQELIAPYHRLREDFEVLLVGTEANKEYKSKAGFIKKSDVASKDVKAEEFAGVMIPGGYAPDHMRRCEATVKFVHDMHQQNKPIGTICHSGWMLAESIDLKGRKVTSVKAIKTDLIHAGAIWEDSEVVVDGNLVSSRSPEDLPVFMREFLKLLSK